MHWWLVTILGVSMASSVPSHPIPLLLRCSNTIQAMGMSLHPPRCIQRVHIPHPTGEGRLLAADKREGGMCHRSPGAAGRGSGGAAAGGAERSDPVAGAERTCPGRRELQWPGAGHSGMPARRGARRGKPGPAGRAGPGRLREPRTAHPPFPTAGCSGDVPGVSPRHLLAGGRVLRRSHAVPGREQGPAGRGDGGERQPLWSLPAGVSPAGDAEPQPCPASGSVS